MRALKQAKPGVVFAALGTPKQEKLIYYLRTRVSVKLFWGSARPSIFTPERKGGPRFGCKKPGWNGLSGFGPNRDGSGSGNWWTTPAFSGGVVKEKFLGKAND